MKKINYILVVVAVVATLAATSLLAGCSNTVHGVGSLFQGVGSDMQDMAAGQRQQSKYSVRQVD